ncbi:MAG TPA: thioredoxin-disulfide reductase [Pilimelia sp.]|nr:thioredoxin-disulfide reductase [Pilimelia sp.]
MSDNTTTRLLIVGGGPAGYTAAIYAGRASLAPICIEGYASGGQIVRSGRVDNFPGQPAGISGAELGERIREQATTFGARMATAEVQSVDLSTRPFVVTTDEATYRTDALIAATGARPRRLGLATEDEFDGMGVCYCAICDGPFFADQRVAVIGGGDAALEEALQLSKIARSVLLVHRRDGFRANAGLRAAVARDPRIEVLVPYLVDDILGQAPAGVHGLQLRNAQTGQCRTVEVDGVFVAIGHEPSSELFRPALATDSHGFLVTADGSTATNVPGVFAAGDVADPRYRQAVTAAASGCAAAIDAERWLISGAADDPWVSHAVPAPALPAARQPVAGRT